MISIVICSRTVTISEALQKNIEETIGVSYEIVLINNSQNQYNIFTAYNKGVALSRFPIICFMHDDIELMTPNWGEIVVTKFIDSTLGAIGVAGAPYYPILAGPWWSGGVLSKYIVEGKGKTTEILAYQTPLNNQLPAVVLDGVWMCIRKSLFEQIRFDSERLQGYHLYDVDICLQVCSLGFAIQSVYDVLIYHGSHGVMNQNWMDNCLEVQKKWSKQLPKEVYALSYAQTIKIEYRALQEFLQVQKANGVSFPKRIRFAIEQVIRYRLPHFKVQFPLVLVYWLGRDLLKKIGLRS